MDKKQLRVDVDRELHNKLKGKAYSEGRTVKEVIYELIEQYLNEKKGKAS